MRRKARFPSLTADDAHSALRWLHATGQVTAKQIAGALRKREELVAEIRARLEELGGQGARFLTSVAALRRPPGAKRRRRKASAMGIVAVLALASSVGALAAPPPPDTPKPRVLLKTGGVSDEVREQIAYGIQPCDVLAKGPYSGGHVSDLEKEAVRRHATDVIVIETEVTFYDCGTYHPVLDLPISSRAGHKNAAEKAADEAREQEAADRKERQDYASMETARLSQAAARVAPCHTSADRAEITKLTEIIRRFEDAKTLAGSTPRIALTGPASKMQDISREIEAQADEMPACAAALGDIATKGSQQDVQLVLAFMRDPNYKVGPTVNYWSAFSIEVQRQLSAPLATPTSARTRKRTPTAGAPP